MLRLRSRIAKNLLPSISVTIPHLTQCQISDSRRSHFDIIRSTNSGLTHATWARSPMLRMRLFFHLSFKDRMSDFTINCNSPNQSADNRDHGALRHLRRRS